MIHALPALQSRTLRSTKHSVAWLIALTLATLTRTLSGDDQIVLTDSTATSGIAFTHDDGADDEGYLVSMMGSGLASFDFDNDGLIDIYFLNGTKLPFSTATRSEGNVLYRNCGRCKFENVSKSALGNKTEFGLGVTVGDVDNDGFQDVAVSNFGSVTLLHNNGDGTLSDWTISSGLSESGIAFGAGIAFLDMDSDGDLDLYVADYVNFTFERFNKLAPSSRPYPPGPSQFNYRSDHLFRNDGQGTFSDWSSQAGIANLKSPSMGVVCGDFDSDNDTDIFVCCDARPNLLWINDGHGAFTEQADLFAVSYNSQGVPVGSMGADAADINNDGFDDLFVTDYSAQMPLLFLNSGSFGFQDASASSRAGREVVAHANWGAGLIDFDNDGDRDLLIGNGHLFKWAHQVEQMTAFKVPNTLLANNGKGVFTSVTKHAGTGMDIVESARGIVFEDLDNDGDVDAVVLNSDAPASFLENQTQSKNNWIQIQLVGTSFNRDGVGAKVTVECDGLVQVAEVHSGRGYQSHFGNRLHFGLGNRTVVNRIKVNWLGQATEEFQPIVNAINVIKQ